MAKKYIRAWLSENYKTVCWQHSSKAAYYQNSVCHWVFGDIVVFQNWQDNVLTDAQAALVAQREVSRQFVVNRVNLDFWEGGSWNRKKINRDKQNRKLR